jgi:hypothetical protein
MITRERGCLRHDDRIDALAGAIRYVVEKLDFDTKLVMEARRRKEIIAGIDAWADPVTRRTWLTEVCIGQQQQKARNMFSGAGRQPGRRRRNRF